MNERNYAFVQCHNTIVYYNVRLHSHIAESNFVYQRSPYLLLCILPTEFKVFVWFKYQ